MLSKVHHNKALHPTAYSLRSRRSLARQEIAPQSTLSATTSAQRRYQRAPKHFEELFQPPIMRAMAFHTAA